LAWPGLKIFKREMRKKIFERRLRMKNLKVRIIGKSPLLMHNQDLENPLNEFMRAIKKISGKRVKVDADNEEMSKLEWLGGLYTFNGKIIIPGRAINAMILEAGRKERKGKDVKWGLLCEDAILKYEGPKSVEELWNGGNHINRMMIEVVKGNRILRTCPQFDKWSAELELQFDEHLLNEEDLMKYFTIAGQRIGLLDAKRLKFGRFSVEKIK